MKIKLFSSLLLLILSISALAQTSMTNIPGRKTTSLNGKWNAIIDPFDVGVGDWVAIWKDRKPQKKTDFVEYSFENGLMLDVPGDFNSQVPELNLYESSVWYKKVINYNKKADKRLFIHFGAINYKSDIYLNSRKLGSHEGGFTPFQFELTDSIKEGANTIIIRVNNARAKDGIPSVGFDWFNYGGITRDVHLVETPTTFIQDYFIQLQKGSANQVNGWVQLNGSKTSQNIIIQIPEAKINYKVTTNADGWAKVQFPITIQRWSPEQPKLYNVKIISETDTIQEMIGFRTIEVKGTEIYLNGKPIFLKGVNIHEEIPERRSRAYSESDALILLNWAKDLGCNMVRLAHYPHNEHTVRLAEKMGLMVWDELPIYQNIDFGNPVMQEKMNKMLLEMIGRDKNRCGVVIWSMSNETYPGKPRYDALANLVKLTRSIDSTRLITSALTVVNYKDNIASIEDSINQVLDVISVNEYFGWYRAWSHAPDAIEWKSTYSKPLIMSEFGGEALYGNDAVPKENASSWSEEYQEQLYKDQLAMLKKIPFLSGTCPWILADFRSPVRMHPVYQQGWNRKGLLSDRGQKKKAWYIMQEFYREK